MHRRTVPSSLVAAPACPPGRLWTLRRGVGARRSGPLGESRAPWRALGWLAILTATLNTLAAGPLELRPEDHICFVGNTLADRMQHYGWLETLIHRRFPKHDLAFRNLAFSGDELSLRSRSEGFGTPDEWLTKEQADVVLAFFGFNESFQGPEGLAKFKRDLDAFITETRKHNYSGKGAPRMVLFSPIAQEKHPDGDVPDPTQNNQRLAAYTEAMAAAARTHQVGFVDLFTPSQRLYAEAKQPLTINGVHLSEAGYRALAPVMFQALFQEAPPDFAGPSLAKLHAAVVARNETWFRRYRTVDGFNVYGGRSYLKFDGVMNRDTMQREMAMRDVLTANADRRVWAWAQDCEPQVADDNLPPAIEVKSNKPGPAPDGAHVFLGGEEAIKHMKLPPRVKANLFASEEQFPELANPVQMAWDTKGRLWVATWPNYPERTPQSKTGDRLLVFEDRDGDGKADHCTTFLDDLNCPTGFAFYRDGVLLAQAPELWFVRDTDRDGRADWRAPVVHGIDSADSHHTANSFALDPGGAVYWQEGVFHRTQIETAWGPLRNNDAGVFRFEPRTGRVEAHIQYGFANPHGHVFDYWGDEFVTDGTGNNNYFATAISGRLDYPQKHAGVKEFVNRRSRPCPGTGILSSRHFPEAMQGDFLNLNVIGFLGIFQFHLKADGSGIGGDEVEPLVQSDDPNFRPSAVSVGPDGAVYFLDWHNPLIGHMQHHLRDPSRDHAHGRVYRLTYEGRPLLRPVPIAGAPIPRLLDLLKEPEDGTRLRAKLELSTRDTRQVIAALRDWAAALDPQDPAREHHLLEALWVHQWLNVVDEARLRQVLRSPEPRARAAATRVLCAWRDGISDPLALLRPQVNDSSPRVRLEAVRAASFFRGRAAQAVACETLKYDMDYYLDFVFNETMRALVTSPKDVFFPTDPKALSRVLGRLSNHDLAQAPDVEPVLVERLQRPGLEINPRNQALLALVHLRHTDRVTEALAALGRFDATGGAATVATDLALLLTISPAEDLARARAALAKLAASASQPAVRRAAYAGLVTADGKPEPLWAETATDEAARATLIDAIIALPDPEARVRFQPFLTASLTDARTPDAVRRAALRALPLMGPENGGANFALLAQWVRGGQHRPLAARGLLQLPRTVWAKDQAGPVTEAIVAWAKTVPVAERTSEDYVQTVQLGNEMTALLPRPEAARVTKELRALGVSVFVVKSVLEGMRYDTTRLIVEAGKPFEIVFENVDMMPHNLVVVQPRAREEIGRQAQDMAPAPDAQGRVYVPNSPKILAATRLLEPGHKETLKLTAPKEPGQYEYLCTYPEHWQVMFGQLVVVAGAEALVQASLEPLPVQPAATPAATNLPPGAALHQHGAR